MQQRRKQEFTSRLRYTLDLLGTRREAADVAGVSLDAITRYLRGDNQPGFLTISKICDAAGVSMHWLATGDGQSEKQNAFQTIRGIPLAGMSEAKDTGWFNPQQSSVQTTLDLPDPKAFATLVNGQSLIPEGIQPGFVCICSPMMGHAPGDIVHLRRQDGLCTLRIYVGEEKDWLILKAYTDRDEKSIQRPFEDRIKRSMVIEVAPVVFVRRKA